MEPFDLRIGFLNSSIKYPQNIALIYGDQKITYEELHCRSERLASWLLSRGVGPGTIIPIAFERSIEMITTMLGIITAGGAYLPIDIDSPAARIHDILTDSGAVEMLTTNSIASNITLPAHIQVHCLDAPELKDEIAG